MSVAFDAQGEIVPRRGATTIVSAPASDRRRLAVAQQRLEPVDLGLRQGAVAPDPVHVTRGDALDAVDRAAQPGKKRLGAKPRQRVAAFEAGEVLGLGRHSRALGGVGKRVAFGLAACGATSVETRDSRAPMR